MAKSSSSSDQKTMGMLAHLLGIFTGFVGPLVMYLMQKDTKGKALENAKHALNFQLTLLIGYLIGIVLILIIIGMLVIWAVGVIGFIFTIIGTVKAAQGEVYTYPLEIKFIK